MGIEWNGVKCQASKQQYQSRPKERRAPGRELARERWSGCRWLPAHSRTSLTGYFLHQRAKRREETRQDKTRQEKGRGRATCKAAESEAMQMEGARQGPGRRQGEANQPRRRPSEITNALNLAARVEQLQQRHAKQRQCTKRR